MQHGQTAQIERERANEAARRRDAIVMAQEALFDENDRNPRQYANVESFDEQIAKAA